MSRAAPSERAANAALLDDYHVAPGQADELFDADGTMRPVWTPLIDRLTHTPPEETRAQFAIADQYLRDAGVFYRQYTAEAPLERDWPLSHIPLILQDGDWEDICTGLSQRAELLEAVVADLYGPGRLVAERHLPAELVAQNPEWHRPLVGVQPASGHFLHYVAFEVGRSPDGSWLVLGDRTQAPSGAGFALENRRASARSFPDLFPRANVLRLASFFNAFRDALEGQAGNGPGRVGIMTPGPGTDTYFEHAYIARYLGLPLLEGEDLLVQDGSVQVRTVFGPQPLDVLWRRLDASYADPLELDPASRLGTPGLVDALRQGRLHLVNALGSGILETRALMAFLPKLSQHLLGTPLALPNVATWWCGQPSERAYVKANAGQMFLGDALSRALPFDIALGGDAGPSLPEEPGARADWIDARAGTLVGQEQVRLSTTPVWEEGRLVPRPMTIRVFAARTAQGWTFMPGGYARIGRSKQASALAMQQGGAVADVWITRETGAPKDTLMGPGTTRRTEQGALPSRAADNLFWLGRYIERTEGAVRLLRSFHLRLAESGSAEDPRLVRLAEQLETLHLDAARPASELIAPMLRAASLSAGKVRDRFSVDGWAALADLTSSLRDMETALPAGDATARALTVLLRKITGFNGLVHENMHRTSAWRFLTFGRALERADGAAAALEAFAEHSDLLDMALEYADSRITYQRRYRIDPKRDTVADLLALDGNNPRAILFQVTAMVRIARDLPRAEVFGRTSEVLAVLLPLEARLMVAHPQELDAEALAAIRTDLADLSGRLTTEYLT